MSAIVNGTAQKSKREIQLLFLTILLYHFCVAQSDGFIFSKSIAKALAKINAKYQTVTTNQSINNKIEITNNTSLLSSCFSF
jgi:hypothetical protein